MKGASMKLACALVALTSLSAAAAVGRVAVVDGPATRNGKPVKVGDEVNVNDHFVVKGKGLKLVLNDESVLMLAPGTELRITEADFAGQERKGFSARLLVGKIWAKVTKALSGAKFEVSTEQAVAGVRGTIFRIDAETLVKAAKPKVVRTVVRVSEGKVAVAPSKLVAQAMKKQEKQQNKERVQVPGPTEVTADQWERIYEQMVERDQQIVIELSGMSAAAPYDPSAKNDDFQRWVDANP